MLADNDACDLSILAAQQQALATYSKLFKSHVEAVVLHLVTLFSYILCGMGAFKQ